MTSFWNGRSPHTLRAYQYDVEAFTQFLIRREGLDRKTPQIEVLRVFFGLGAGRANLAVIDWRSEMRSRDCAPNTINRSLSTIRQLVRLARMVGAAYWNVEVDGVAVELTRDTRGPDPATVAAVIALAGQQRRPFAATRDVAMVRLMFDLGLRVGEVTRLDLSDLELGDKPCLWVLGKKRLRKELLKLPAPTVDAIRRWLAIRGRHAGPLFLSQSAFHKPDRRLDRVGVWRILHNLGARLGIHLHPHKLRHSAITQAVEQSIALRISLDQVRHFSRHKNITTLLIYRDETTNQQSALARAVAGTVSTPEPTDSDATLDAGRKSDDEHRGR